MLEKLNYLKLKGYNSLIENRRKILKTLVLLTIVLGLSGFSWVTIVEYDSSISLFTNIITVISNTFGLFVGEWNDNNNWLLTSARISGVLTILLSVIVFSLEKYFQNERVKFAQKNPYDLIIGLSEQNVSLLKNEYTKDNVIIVSKNKDDRYFDYFKKNGFPIMGGSTKDSLDELDFTNMKDVIISTGKDRKNIALGKHILEKEIESKNPQTLHICISNRDLNVLFKQNVITSDMKKNNLIISTYSLYENMARKLFVEHSILGLQPNIINTEEEFNIVVVGDSDLAVELVYHLAFLGTLPNQNKLIVHLVGVNAQKFECRIRKIFPEIDKIPFFELRHRELDSEIIAFYRDDVWKSKNLTNILIATQNEEQNLDIAINLQDTTYIRDIGHNRFNTKVLFALYHNLGLANEIDKNTAPFKNFHSFANIKDVSTKEVLIEEKFDKIARVIHYDYLNKKSEFSLKSENEEWQKLDQHRQDANKTQALHIDVKLLAFGLKKCKLDLSSEELLRLNRKIFNEKLKESHQLESKIKNYKSTDFPTSFESLFDRVARAEHNRWNAFHYLSGWAYGKEKKVEAKEHPCLQPLEEFETEEKKDSYPYDMASVYYLPNYLASVGFEIVDG